MEEQITTEKKKFDFSALLQPNKLFLGAAGCLILAVLVSFIPALLSALTTEDSAYALQNLASSVSGSVQDLLLGLILPLSLFLLIANTNKAKLSKIFFVAAIAVVLVQLAGAVILVINTLSKDGIPALYYLFYWVPGGGLLASPLSTIITIFDVKLGFLKELTMLVSSVLRSLSQLLYILPNGICAFAFFKLSSAKKRRKPAVEEAE